MLNIEKLKKDLEKLSTPEGPSIRWMYPPEGVTRVRILPALFRSDVFYEIVARHRVPDSESPRGIKSYICKKLTFGQECPICSAYEILQKSKSTYNIDDKLIKSLKPYFRIYVNAIIKGWKRALQDPTFIYPDTFPSEQPVLLVIPQTVHTQILNLILGEYGDITDPQNGRDIDIVRTTVGNRTEYSVQPVPNPSPIENASEIFQKAYDLKSVVAEMDEDYESLQERFLQGILGASTTNILAGVISNILSGYAPQPLTSPTPSAPSIPSVSPTPTPTVQPTSPSPTPTAKPTVPPTPTQAPTVPPTPTTPSSIPIPEPQTPPSPTPTQENSKSTPTSPENLRQKLEELKKKFSKGSS